MFQKNKVLLYFLFLGLLVRAQNNSLVIFSETGKPFYLSINNESINKTLQANVKTFDLNTGFNFIDITIPLISSEYHFKDSILVTPSEKISNKELTYTLIEKEDKFELHFVSISEKSGPFTPTIAEKPLEKTSVISDFTYGNLYKIVTNKPIFFNNFNTQSNTCLTNLSEKELNYAIDLLKNVTDSETRLTYISSIINNNCFKVSQFKPLTDFLTTEMDKLSVSKNAFHHFTDQENIALLFPIFKYPAIKESYITFLKEQESIKKQKNLQCAIPINDSDFEKYYLQLKKMTYETEKLNQSKKIAGANCLSSKQIKQLTDFFTHDRDKLDFLKCAINILTDKENIGALAEDFQFQESKTEFLKLISK